MELLTRKIKEIEMPDDMRERIIRNCYKNAEITHRKCDLYEESRKKEEKGMHGKDKMKEGRITNNIIKMDDKIGEKTMKKRTETRRRKKQLAMAATLLLCICLTGVTALAGTGKLKGFFKDITNWNGAITGTTYEQATEEITVSAEAMEERLSILVTMVQPEEPPYCYTEKLRMGSYRIENMSGKMIGEYYSDSSFPVNNGEVKIEVPLDNISNGDYKLVIDSFVSEKKADQPLEIKGHWECMFSYYK